MKDLFADIVGQEMAVTILQRSLEQGPAHAYLFSGPAGVGKNDAAVEFAAGLACEEGGCGRCSVCERVRQGLHPDVEIVAPEGNFIRKEEITAINMQAAYRPFEARAKVYVFSEADSFNTEAANAFLKTLEEPPPHVFFILVTDHVERLLPTVVSRCQSVMFAEVPHHVVAADLQRRHGLAVEEAASIARVAGGDLSYARELAASESARRQREFLLDLARDLPITGLAATEDAIDEVMATIEQRAQEKAGALDSELEQALEWAGDARTKNWLKKRHEEKTKRQSRRLVTQGLGSVTRMCASWYRDLAVVSVGAEEAVLNQDRLDDLRRQAVQGDLAGYAEAVRAVRQTQERLRYNVDARLAIGNMFRTIKEALVQWPMS